jgi:epoxyqueuosine reductase
VIELLQAATPLNVRIGVTDLSPFDESREQIEARVADGLSGGLGFVYREPGVSTTPADSFPWARSIVVAAVPYLRAGDGESTGSIRPIARFADGDRYDQVRSTLDALEGVLVSKEGRCEQVYDDDRLVDRAVAIRAGVAWSGKSTMALTPGAGPWFLIGSVVTDLRITPTQPMARSCGTCTACIPACPTGAIIAPGVLDARLCLAAVLQRPGSIPVELRSKVGGRIYGCDDCLVACPPGDKELGSYDSYADQPTPRRVLEMTDEAIEELSRHWYVPKRNTRFVRRNAIVALGNTGGPDDVPLLAGYLGHPDAILRGHAAWAISVIGGPVASAVLDEEEHSSEGHAPRVLS